jgi:outer membrane protein assembly factor BamB
MEFFGARPDRPIETCLDEVRGSDIVVVIIGGRYGSLVPGRDISFSEAEYDEACRLGKPCLVYILDGAENPVADQNPEKLRLLNKWKAVLNDRHTVSHLTDSGKLAVQVVIDLGRELRRMEAEAAGSRHPPKAVTAPVSVTTRWSQRFGDQARQLLHGLATDHDGNIFITGDFWGSVDFGGQILTSKGDRDIFLAKFDRVGTHIWSKRYGDEQEQVGNAIATDSAGAVFIGGSFTGSLDFGGGELVSRGRYNVCLAKLDHAGQHIWSCRFGDDKYHVLECLAVAPSGNITIAGRFQGSIDFGNGSIASQSSQTDIFVANFSPNGECLWAKRFGGPYEQQTRSVAIDDRGNIAIAGIFKGEVSFDKHVLAEQRPSDYCGFLTKLDVNGQAQWCKRLGDPHVEQGTVVTFDRSNGDLITAGFIRNKLPVEVAREVGSLCLFARYDRSGILQWSKTIVGVICSSLDVAQNGRILFCGHFSKSTNFGLGPLVSAGGNDVVAAIFTSDGAALWAKHFGDSRQQFLIKGVHGVDRSIVLAGSFHGTIDFGAGILSASGYDGTGEGAEDVFLTTLDEK